MLLCIDFLITILYIKLEEIMEAKMKLLLDTNGGDYAPLEIIKGAIDGAREYHVSIGLVGEENAIKNTLAQLDTEGLDIEIIPAKEKIENTEEPAFAIRKKKDSSIVVGLNALKEGRGDAMISAGSTGALLAGGLFLIGRIAGVKRAILPTIVPGYSSETMIIDSGANMDCDSNLLVQFARMGSAYLQCLKGVETPKVGLLNVGSEPGKGNALSKETYQALQNAEVNFIGNVEAREITSTEADLVVCDGFDGNILLKSIEGTAEFILKLFSQQVKNSEMSMEDKMKIGTFAKKFAANFDSSEVGGTILLGLKKLVIKAHGNSDAKAVKNAMGYAVKMIESNMIERMEKNLGGNL